MSRLTTHILDTSIGKPAEGISVLLEMDHNGEWKNIARGITNSDGRIMDLVKADSNLETGHYRLVFETAAYFEKQNKKTFYPRITIEFAITDLSHYHVPLLLNPFGYSTYRGS
jgi:5-hydroxyisourate hydrolase